MTQTTRKLREEAKRRHDGHTGPVTVVWYDDGGERWAEDHDGHRCPLEFGDQLNEPYGNTHLWLVFCLGCVTTDAGGEVRVLFAQWTDMDDALDLNKRTGIDV